MQAWEELGVRPADILLPQGWTDSAGAALPATSLPLMRNTGSAWRLLRGKAGGGAYNISGDISGAGRCCADKEYQCGYAALS